MKQFLSNTVSPTVVRLRKESSRAVPRPKAHSNGAVVTITGVAISCIVAGYLVQDLPAGPILVSLFIGFAPLFGLGALLLINALIISFFICAAEKIFADEEDDDAVPEPQRSDKWRRGAPFPPNHLAHSLSLKEHSPPAFLLS